MYTLSAYKKIIPSWPTSLIFTLAVCATGVQCHSDDLIEKTQKEIKEVKIDPKDLQKNHSQKTIVAKKVPIMALLKNFDLKGESDLNQFKRVEKRLLRIHQPGASFIKVHFSRFQLPHGVKVELRSDDGLQKLAYEKTEKSLFTLHDGDDGEQSFSALSILGDTVWVEVIHPQSLSQNGPNNKRYRVEIDSIMEGYPEEEWLFNDLALASPDIEPQSTCGVNERKDVQCWAQSHPTEFERSRPVARLLINGSASCTAWRVGPDNRLFTNNHCISSATGPSKTEVWFNYQKSGCSSGSTSGRVVVTGDQLLATNSDLDFTLFTVKKFSQVEQFGYFGLDVRDPIEQERIYIPQHGRGQPKQLAITSDQNADNLCRVDVTLADGSAPNTDMGYLCDTIGGSSGSPVLAASSDKVLALHHFGGCPNQGVLINQIWPKVATHFNHQIPDGDNDDGGSGTLPIASFSYQIDGLEVTFTDTSEDFGKEITAYSWSFGDGSSSTLKNPTHLYSQAGDYEVSLTITDIGGKTDSDSQTIALSDGLDGQLISGTVVGNLNASTNEELHFYIDVPEASRNLSFAISGGSGDADLYVKFGEKPSSSNYDCRPYKGGNSESCNFNAPTSGRWYVMLKAYKAFAGVNLLARYSEQVDGVNFTKEDLSDQKGNWQHFTLEVPDNRLELLGEISGGTGDADLYVRYGSQPTSSGYDCRPYKSGNNETCRINNPQAGTWYFSVRAYSNYSGVKLSGSAQ